MRAALSTAAALLLVSGFAASAACDVKSIKLEEEIADKKVLQKSANEQTVRDLRTLRDAAIVLDAFKFEPECERLVAIVSSSRPTRSRRSSAAATPTRERPKRSRRPVSRKASTTAK